MLALQEFISDAIAWPLSERAAFVDQIMLLWRGDGFMLIPDQLSSDLIRPTLTEWCKMFPAQAVAHRWLGFLTGDCSHLKEAIRLDPNEQIARSQLLARLTGKVDYAVHELPAGYIGDPLTDLSDLDLAEVALAGLTDEKLRQCYAAEIVSLRQTVQSFHDYQCSGSMETFEDWAHSTGRRSRHIDP